LVARLLPPESASADVVSREVGVSVATLERWRAAALAEPGASPGGEDRWTPGARLVAVIATASMDEASRSAWCREHGLYVADLERWKRDAMAGPDPGPSRCGLPAQIRPDRPSGQTS
jgi:hypothetical protein